MRRARVPPALAWKRPHEIPYPEGTRQDARDGGATLDFKRDQYVFSKASERQKAEFLKDVLAFANWRRTSASGRNRSGRDSVSS